MKKLLTFVLVTLCSAGVQAAGPKIPQCHAEAKEEAARHVRRCQMGPPPKNESVPGMHNDRCEAGADEENGHAYLDAYYECEARLGNIRGRSR